MKRVAFVTFGCKINQYDTQAIRESVLDLGYQEVSAGDDTDLLVVNSCTVTERAGEKGVAAVRKLIRRHPEAQMLVTGCLSPEDREALSGIPQVEFVVGNEEKDQIPALIQGNPIQPVRGRRSRNIFNLQASGFEGRTRAFLKVHDGCDDFCSYCIIPFLRGKSMSRHPDDVLAEAERMAAGGYRELVITGIHLRRYGADLGLDFGLRELMRSLRQIDGIDRVRLSSVGMKVFDDAFLDFLADDPGLCRFFHIPLQSGSDSVLDRMRREHTAAEYLDTVQRIRARLDRSVITTDLMVGFPGETEAEFQESLDTCREAQFAFLHIFPYSRRSGTKAAQMPDPVAASVKKERMERARSLEAELVEAEGERWIGEDVQVLVERETGDQWQGLSREGHRVFLLPHERASLDGRSVRNQEVTARVVSYGSRGLHAEWVPTKSESIHV